MSLQDDHERDQPREDGRRVYYFTPDETRGLLNLLDTARELQTFTEQQKQDLAHYLQNARHLAVPIELEFGEHKDVLRFLLSDELDLAERKAALKFLLENHAHIKKNVEARKFRDNVVHHLKWFGVQAAGLVGFIVACNEFYEKVYLAWRHHP